mmetsp:Transcript_80382/g.245703  ORF Transcript_80382/g.245703 Transcript_80382/m.245703 type:complete len:218 (+) Transcript_80382:319-972(+)
MAVPMYSVSHRRQTSSESQANVMPANGLAPTAVRSSSANGPSVNTRSKYRTVPLPVRTTRSWSPSASQSTNFMLRMYSRPMTWKGCWGRSSILTPWVLSKKRTSPSRTSATSTSPSKSQSTKAKLRPRPLKNSGKHVPRSILLYRETNPPSQWRQCSMRSKLKVLPRQSPEKRGTQISGPVLTRGTASVVVRVVVVFVVVVREVVVRVKLVNAAQDI